METPSSTRRITRSQASAMASEKRGITQSREKSAEKKKKDRSALIDITNDSPIVGLAINHETPSSAMSKKRIVVANLSKYTRTPGSGEALLRGQVKSLLQKVEEEAGFSKITIEKRPLFDLQGLVNSPALSLIAPTPANTPQLLIDEEGTKSDDMVTRTLLFDISEISGATDGDDEDDSSSIWSIQVNASSTREDEDEEGGGEEEDSGLLDELCEGMSNIMSVGLPKFMGKHIRFVYNSDDDEIRVEEEIVESGAAAALED